MREVTQHDWVHVAGGTKVQTPDMLEWDDYECACGRTMLTQTWSAGNGSVIYGPN
jgi:hypothetical protein